MICVVALRTVSFSLKFGTAVKSILSKSNASKLCGVIPACTLGNGSSGFYGPNGANIHLGDRSVAFQENRTPG